MSATSKAHNRAARERGRSPAERLEQAAYLVAAVAATLLVSTQALAQEARCTELDQNCVCSEPMQDTSTKRIYDAHNFADSPADSDCDQYYKAFGTGRTEGVPIVAEHGMPAGNTVERVVEISSAGNDVFWFRGDQKPTASEQRMCMRYYRYVSTDYSGTGPNGIGCPSERNKIMQLQWTSIQSQLQEKAAGSECTGPGTGNDYQPITMTPNNGTGNHNLSPRVDFGDCNTDAGWCRIEVCIAGDLDTGKGVVIHSKITTLSDGVDHVSSTPKYDYPSGYSATTGADHYHGQGKGGTGTSWVSHFMQARWDTDEGQWIGPAYEIEGGSSVDIGQGSGDTGSDGGGGSTTPPPASASIDPPVLLGSVYSSGGQELGVSVAMVGDAPRVTASVANGTGPYHFLYDCGVDGNWNGVDDTASSVSSYTCSSGTQQVLLQVWDEGTDVLLQDVVSAP